MCTQTYTLAGAGCQSLLQCCFSLTCLIQSKTVSRSDRRRKLEKTRSGERDRLLLFFFLTDMTLSMRPKLNFLFLSDNIVSGAFCHSLNVLRRLLHAQMRPAHTGTGEKMQRERYERSGQRNILHCQLVKGTPAKQKKRVTCIVVEKRHFHQCNQDV